MTRLVQGGGGGGSASHPTEWRYISSVPFSHSVMSNSVTPWIVARQASVSITNSWSLLKLMSIELVMPFHHFILCCPLLLPRRYLFIYKHAWEKPRISEHLFTVIQLKSHHFYNFCSGNFSSCSLGDHLCYQAPPVTPPSLATWSTALTSAFPAPASWTLLSTVRRCTMNPSGVRCLSTTQGPPRSAVLASQFTLDPWATGSAEATAWAMNVESATHWALDPMASDPCFTESVASLPWATDPNSTTQCTWLLGAAKLLVINQPSISGFYYCSAS